MVSSCKPSCERLHSKACDIAIKSDDLLGLRSEAKLELGSIVGIGQTTAATLFVRDGLFFAAPLGPGCT